MVSSLLITYLTTHFLKYNILSSFRVSLSYQTRNHPCGCTSFLPVVTSSVLNDHILRTHVLGTFMGEGGADGIRRVAPACRM